MKVGADVSGLLIESMNLKINLSLVTSTPTKMVERDSPCAPTAGSRRRAEAALWRAAKAEGLPALPSNSETKHN